MCIALDYTKMAGIALVAPTSDLLFTAAAIYDIMNLK
jgi:hypothetical protein